jgi:hypothetical protein
MIRNLGAPMSILMPLSLVSAVFLLILLRNRSKAFALAVAGFLLMILALVVTLAIEVPIDKKTELWKVTALPPTGRRFATAGSFITPFSLLCPLQPLRS